MGQGKDLSSYIQTSKSSFGRGGMLTKTNIARKVADEGITVIIANGKRDNILVDLIQHPESTLCTRFTPSPEPVSSVKKWIAHSEGFAKGKYVQKALRRKTGYWSKNSGAASGVPIFGS